ncbi:MULTISPECIES: ATP-binding protein [unclassified Streptomyces]|uniref:ATP-binding protein n=1 Tax=unclassified Streptomyces TaxID=2593676 RepID=UPI002366A5B6|nr:MULTISPECIES: ATP-binding protein [unclassified Streptomyces]MDF3141692.1 ATP-binding protein [Streptomyces sp. T21Q-yed]WDF40957.1 ATP-binding protein [Streptomyces sp. T12]
MTITMQEEAPAPKVMRWNWTRHPKCVALARSQLRKYLRHWNAEDLTDPAVLLLSELVTNSVRHARVSPGREIETVFEVTEERLRVEVSDASNQVPIMRHVDDSEEEGRGLSLVATVASRWGTDPRMVNGQYAVGKTVWFEIDRKADA